MCDGSVTSDGLLSFFFLVRKKPYMSTNLSNTILETSRNVGLLQSTSSWHQRLWNTSAVMVGRPLSQGLSTPARSRMSEPTSSQSRLIWDLAAETTLAGMCAACVGCSGRD